jgi:hypothetical protein
LPLVVRARVFSTEVMPSYHVSVMPAKAGIQYPRIIA